MTQEYDDRNTETIWGKGSNPRGPDYRREVILADGSKKVTAYWKRKPEDNQNGPIFKAKTQYFNADGSPKDLPDQTGQQQAPAPRVGSEASGTIDDEMPF
jgi:hypothetical protein